MTEVAHLPRLPSAAERMRLYRERRRRGLSCIKVQLRRSEVDALIADCWNPPTGRIVGPYRQRFIDISMPTQSQDADSDAQHQNGDTSRPVPETQGADWQGRHDRESVKTQARPSARSVASPDTSRQECGATSAKRRS